MEDLVNVLTKFHREIVVSDIERIVGNVVEGAERRLRDEMQTGFDALAQRLDKLEIESRSRNTPRSVGLFGEISWPASRTAPPPPSPRGRRTSG